MYDPSNSSQRFLGFAGLVLRCRYGLLLLGLLPQSMQVPFLSNPGKKATCDVIRKIRTTIASLFIISLIVNFGMWWERFVIIVGGVAHGVSPHAWGLYRPTMIEFGIMFGTFCLFFFLFMLFAKHLPSVSMTEMKETLEGGHDHAA